jgi:hypothetical protein
MLLHDLQIRLALQATQDFSLFDFVLIHIDFGAAFWTTYQGGILLSDGCL